MISIVVPVYNEEGNVEELARRVARIMESVEGGPEYELIFVNDGSTDGTLAALRRIARTMRQLVIVNLARNFGHQLAATAGLEAARGDAVILMDGDLQDPPELIVDFIAKWREGYDVVYAIRRSRKGERLFKRVTAGLFYRLVRRLTKVDIPLDTGDFRLMSRRVVDALAKMRERHRFLRGLVSWVGFNQIGIEYDRDARYSGTTKYPLSKMLRFAVDGVTSFSDIPLRLASLLGFVISIGSFFVGIYEVSLKLFTGYNLPGYTSTIFAILFLGGVQLIGIGILGEYIGRIYDEIKGRPLYLVAGIERATEPGTVALALDETAQPVRVRRE
jgi:glycosyltransferase involved in cell wall biosynthesis